MKYRHIKLFTFLLVSSLSALPPAEIKTTITTTTDGQEKRQEHIQGQLGFLLADLSKTEEKPALFNLPNSDVAMYSLATLYPAFREKYVKEHADADEESDEGSILEMLDKKLKEIRFVGVRDANNIIVIGQYDGLLGHNDGLEKDCDALNQCIFMVKTKTMGGACIIGTKENQSCLQRGAEDIYLPPAKIPITTNGDLTDN